MKKCLLFVLSSAMLMFAFLIAGTTTSATFAAETGSEAQDVHVHNDEWTALNAAYVPDNGATLSDGQYYLSEDVTGNLTVTVCLNGYTFTGQAHPSLPSTLSRYPSPQGTVAGGTVSRRISIGKRRATAYSPLSR